MPILLWLVGIPIPLIILILLPALNARPKTIPAEAGIYDTRDCDRPATASSVPIFKQP
ncbi:MAG TPA: hypothetical protein VIJ35_26345 [Bradyrhizobium sp.]